MVKFAAPTSRDIEAAIAAPDKLTRTQLAVATGGLHVSRYYGPLIAGMTSSGDPNVVPSILRPRSGDWLAEHAERGQTFKSFLQRPSTVAPHGSFDTIALVVLGKGMSPPTMRALRRYISAFYQMEVVLVGPVDVEAGMEDGTIRSRVNEDTGDVQMFCKDAMRAATAAVRDNRSLSRRVVASLALTMIDLTPNESWNFVYGQASLTEAHGVFSLARFSPSFNDEVVGSAAEEERIILERACKVATHELGHIFGLKHCIYYTCLMNGANHVGEVQKQPLQECPVCLKKLLHSFGWDLRMRYRQLAEVSEELGLEGFASALQASHLPMTLQHHAARADTPQCLGAMYGTAAAAAKPAVRVPKSQKISHRKAPRGAFAAVQ